MENDSELLSVNTLRQHLDRKGQLSLAEASVLMDRIAEFVDALQLNGQVHGAIHAGNILLLPGNQVRLLSPRNGRETPRFAGGSGKTFAGDTQYLSPEEVRGEPVTAATDIWCLGALLYEMLTGYPPFFALHLCKLRQTILLEEPELLPACASAAQPVVDCALAKWAANRFLSAQALANMLWAVSPGAPAVAQAQSGTDRISLQQAVNRPLVRDNGTAGQTISGVRRWTRFFSDKRQTLFRSAA